MILGQATYTVTRRDGYTVDASGRQVPGVESTFDITASIQPPSGTQLQKLPEGIRQSISYIAFTESYLRTENHAAGLPSDLVTVEGALFEVVAVQRWNAILPHYEVALMALKEAGGRP